jgi:RNA recognition motif-containing protein
MKNNNRSRSRGSRRKGRRGGGGNSQGGNRPRGPRNSSKPKKPETLWEKIKAFFSGDSYQSNGSGNGGSRKNQSSKPTAKSSGNGKDSSGSGSGSGSKKNKKPKRKPELVEVTSPRLYVGNLNFDATESDLFELFNGVGSVQNAEVVSNPYTHRSKGFAFVQMGTMEEAKRAVDELHNKDFMGRPLVVSGAKNPKNRGEGNNEEE